MNYDKNNYVVNMKSPDPIVSIT